MAIVIRNEKDLMVYLESLKETEDFADLKAVAYIDANEDLDARVESFFSNGYKGGLSLMLGVFEAFYEDMGGYARCQIMGQLSMLKKYKKAEPGTLIDARIATRVMLIKLLMGLKGIAQAKLLEGNVEMNYEFVVDQNKLLPIGNVANVDAVGYLADFEMVVEMDYLKE